MKSNSSILGRLGHWRSVIAVWAAGATALWMMLCAGCGSQPAAGAPKSAPAAAAKPAAGASASLHDSKASNGLAQVKSVFHLDPKFGRDPFFPGSRPELSRGQDALAPTPQLPLMSYLKLVGLRPGTARPMALINRSPIAQGEEGEVSVLITNLASRVEVKKVNVRCLEVRRDSVLISIAGEQGTRELRMAQAK